MTTQKKDENQKPETITLDLKAIEAILPHRGFALMIDSAWIAIDSNRNSGDITAKYKIPHDYPILPGHFPGNPIFRGVDILEAMAQTSALLAYAMFPSVNGVPYFESAADVKFMHKAVPGDELLLSAEFKSIADTSNRRLNKTTCCSKAIAMKATKPIASATIYGAVTSLKTTQTSASNADLSLLTQEQIKNGLKKLIEPNREAILADCAEIDRHGPDGYD